MTEVKEPDEEQVKNKKKTVDKKEKKKKNEELPLSKKFLQDIKYIKLHLGGLFDILNHIHLILFHLVPFLHLLP